MGLCPVTTYPGKFSGADQASGICHYSTLGRLTGTHPIPSIVALLATTECPPREHAGVRKGELAQEAEVDWFDPPHEGVEASNVHCFVGDRIGFLNGVISLIF